METCEITLHVGLGTFQPVRVKQIEDHHMEAERYEISEAAAAAINRALDERRRVIAVGTTSVRTLESVAREHGGSIAPGRGETRLFIIPGFPFRVIRGLLTNFHLPQSTLLMLVSAFAEKDFVLTRLPPCRGSALPVLQLRRLHVDSVAVIGFQPTSCNPSGPACI